MDPRTKTELGNALRRRADALGFLNLDEIAAAAGIARRTLQPVLNGTWTNPTSSTLRAIESALALHRGSLVTAFTNGNPDIITDQELADPGDPAVWLVQQLSSRGACVDPALLTVMAQRLAVAMPDAARVLQVIAGVAEEGCITDTVLLDDLGSLTGGDRAAMQVAAVDRRRRRMIRTTYPQLPLGQVG